MLIDGGPSPLPAASVAISLSQIAGLAQRLQVVEVRPAAFGNRDDVIHMERLYVRSGPTHTAPIAIAGEYLEAHFGSHSLPFLLPEELSGGLGRTILTHLLEFPV